MCMFEEIQTNLKERLAAQPDSRCASGDEVRMAWLVCEIESLRAELVKREKCLDEITTRLKLLYDL